MNRNISQGGRVFLAALAFGALTAASGVVFGANRVFPAESHCTKQPGTADGFMCGFTTGSDFPPGSIDVIEVDFNYNGLAADTIRALSCRRSWNALTTTCSPDVTRAVLNQGPTVSAYLVTANAAVRGGSQFDHRFLYIGANKEATYLEAKGLYISNSAGN
jgi:hypothetical protein